MTSATITLPISDELCRNLLTACYEGGSAYWLSCDSVVYTGHDTDEYGVSEIKGCFDGENDDKFGDADFDTMRKGIALLVAPNADISSTIRDNILGCLVDPDHDWDADDADAVLQFGLLGELVYG